MFQLALALGFACLAPGSQAEDVCKGHRCDTGACPCGCECGSSADAGLCYVPKGGLTSSIPQLMLAVQGSGTSCDKPDWSCISEKTVAVPKPAIGQALIAIHGSGVNPVNVDLVEPSCAHAPPGSGFGCSNGTIGNDGAGVVVQVGADCSVKLGDQVWGFFSTGSYAQYAVTDCKRVGLKPASLSFVDAGTIPVVAGTSLQCLKAAGMPSKKSNLTVVVTSGQGGTGFMAVQLAKALGASRVITAATGAGIEFVKSMGADIVVDYHKQDLADALQDDSVDIVFDNFGALGTADKMMHAIRSGGTFLVLLGGNGGTISKHPKAGVRQVPFGIMTAATEELNELQRLFQVGKVHPHTLQPTYSLSEVPQAFTRLRSGGVLGKIAVVPTQAIPSMTVV